MSRPAARQRRSGAGFAGVAASSDKGVAFGRFQRRISHITPSRSVMPTASRSRVP